MILPKTSITDVDLDEFERQLREFESSRLKSSTAGVSEHPQVEAAQVSGGKNPKGGRPESSCALRGDASFVCSGAPKADEEFGQGQR